MLRTRPDYPAEAFATGSLGILQPSYHHEYLFVAYRALSNQPLTASERAAWLQIFSNYALFDVATDKQDQRAQECPRRRRR